jgi:competence protein ComEC
MTSAEAPLVDAPVERGWLAETFESEMDEGRGFLWLPVAFGTGILIYFCLPAEPSALVLVSMVLALAVLAFGSRGQAGLFRLTMVVTFVAAGATTMKLRTDVVQAPKLSREMTTVVSGWVSERETAARGGVRVVLRVAHMDDLAPADTPFAVRVTIRTRGDEISVGDALTMTARLRPPSGPVMPGGYDFARTAYYERLGAFGFAYGAPQEADLGLPPLAIQLAGPLERLRQAIAARVTAALPGDRGRVATALITGDRGGISDATQEAMRASGLGHILAISGLHMALIAGSAFWIIRALLALSPAGAQGRPIKKWAAVGALLVATIYLGISGGHVATQRAFVMLAIMLLAIVLDRRAITLRNVAIAAFVVLAVSPESLLTASFQMSFAATVALVAAYEEISALSQRRPRLLDHGAYGVAGWAWRFVLGLSITSLIAGLATTPIAVYHFQRAAPLTLLANLLAMPILALVVMPMAFLAVLVMSLGLESAPLIVMSWGLDWIIGVARWTSALTGSAGSVRMAPPPALVFLVAGFLWLALWRRPWRLFGLVPIVLSVPIAVFAPRPDIVVAADGKTVAVRANDGRLTMIAGRNARFTVENWLRADADPRSFEADDLLRGIRCDPYGCVAEIDDRAKLSVVLHPGAFLEDCHLADIVVSRFEAPARCREEAIVIDRDRLATYGAHALFRLGNDRQGPIRYRIATAYPAVQRPWMPAFNNDE